MNNYERRKLAQLGRGSSLGARQVAQRMSRDPAYAAQQTLRHARGLSLGERQILQRKMWDHGGPC